MLHRAVGRDLIGFQRAQHGDAITQASQRFEQSIQPTRLLQNVEAADRGDDPLAHSSLDAIAVKSILPVQCEDPLTIA